MTIWRIAMLRPDTILSVSSRGTAVEGNLMLGLVTTLNGKAPVELRELPEPQPQRNEALVAVHAFSLNRGELRSVRNNGEGWVPGRMSPASC